jgi:hypothetical protein
MTPMLAAPLAPFADAPFPAANAQGAADPGRMLPYPHVLRFRVVPGPVTRQTIPAELATDYHPPEPDALAGAPRRTIALVERELDSEPNMLTMRELVIAGDEYTGLTVTLTDGEQTTRYRAAAAHFEDATTFFPVLGRLEVWQLIGHRATTRTERGLAHSPVAPYGQGYEYGEQAADPCRGRSQRRGGAVERQ